MSAGFSLPSQNGGGLSLYEVLDLVSGVTGRSVRESGTSTEGRRQWKALCPSHPDRNPSLAVTDTEDGRVLVHCHAGCTTEDVMTALGRGMADLGGGGGARLAEVEAEYVYKDAAGEVAFVVQRWTGKTFRASKPDGSKVSDGDKVLYGLPEVLDAVARGTEVTLVEGEKDADRLRAAGLVATTAPFGASQPWLPTWTETLAGATVHLIQDNDEFGVKHAAWVFQSLGEVADLTWWRPKVGKDVSDHLDLGWNLRDLVHVASTPAKATHNAHNLGSAGSADSAEQSAGIASDVSGPEATPSADSAEVSPVVPPDVSGSVPVPLDLALDREPFPTERLPDWLAAFVRTVAEFSQTPPDMAGTVALGALAVAAAGRVVVVREGWKEPTNLYLLVVAAPGSRKSGVVALAVEPLLEAEQTIAERMLPEILTDRTSREVNEASAEAIRRRLRSDKAKPDDQADLESLLTRLAVPEVLPPRLLADDVTPEKLLSMLAANNGRLGVVSAEGGLLDIIAGRYSQNVPNLDGLLKAHSGDAVAVDRIGRATERVEHPALTLVLMLQPEMLRRLGHNPTFRGRGLNARFCYAVPTNNVGHRNTGADLDMLAMSAYRQRLYDLAVRHATTKEPSPLSLHPAAWDLLREYARTLEPRMAPGSDLAEIADWSAKLVGAAVRIAGLLHLASADEPDTLIAASTMTDALAFADYFLAQAKSAFVAAGESIEFTHARALLDTLRRKGMQRFTKRDLFSQVARSTFPTMDVFDAALDVLCDYGWVFTVEVEREKKGPGRPPSPTYECNRHVHDDARGVRA